MSASPRFSPAPRLPLTPHQDVLDEMFHSLSQPLTSLRCSLELSLEPPRGLSIEQALEQRKESTLVALRHTEKVIGMVQLMREYLDAEQPAREGDTSELEVVLRNVIEDLSSVASMRGVRLCLIGSCAATVSFPESALRRALQYLIAAVVDAQREGGIVMLVLGAVSAAALLRVDGEESFDGRAQSEANVPTTLRRMGIATARRVLENGGATLVGGDVAPAGFFLRIPRRVASV